MKRFLQALLALCLITVIGACSSSQGVSGTYTGKAQGIGEVTVTLTLENSVITNVEIDGPKETNGIGSVVIEKFPEQIVATNSLDVDVISGSTITSNAVISAATAALAEAGLKPEDLVKKEGGATAQVTTQYDVDVVVVGAGGAGMSAAIVAAQNGSNVLVVESQSMVGGNTVRSTGGMNASKTSYQDKNEFGEQAGVEKTLSSLEQYSDNARIVELGEIVGKQYSEYLAAGDSSTYFDSVELMQLDTLIGGKGINDVELVKVLAENSAASIDWLASIGADLTSVGSFGGASVKRIHRPVNAEGKTISVGSYITPILEDAAVSAGVNFVFDTTANTIIMDGEKAVGIKAAYKDGTEITINAKAVVLATGGFGANLEMVTSYKSELEGFCTTNAAGAQGQGIAMATAVGAATVDLEQIQIHPTVHLDADGNASLITEGLRGDGAILVNKEGKRFCDEVGTRDVVSAAEIAQTDSEVWLIVDQKMADASSVIQGYINKGFTVTGNSYEELATAMGVDGATLKATMEAWNTCVANKSDSEFGRTSFAEALDTGPYYALTVTPGIHHTMGGIKINTNTEVLNTAGNVISGLFAAGEVVGGIHGANRLGGNAVADIIVFGRIAGESASKYAK